MHSWKYLEELLEQVGLSREPSASRPIWLTPWLFTLGYNAPEHGLSPEGYDWADKEVLYDALGRMTKSLRPWVKDFHVAQNDATVKGSGSHDKTGRHRLPNDPNGKMEISAGGRSLASVTRAGSLPAARSISTGDGWHLERDHDQPADLERYRRQQ
jgi:hypothetical protein